MIISQDYCPERKVSLGNPRLSRLSMFRRISTTALRVICVSRPYPCGPTSGIRLASSIRLPDRVQHRLLPLKRFFSVTSQQCQELQHHNPRPEKENIYTIPNVLTLSRIFSCPILGWSILDGNYPLASGLLLYAGLTDLVSQVYFFISKCLYPEIPVRRFPGASV